MPLCTYIKFRLVGRKIHCHTIGTYPTFTILPILRYVKYQREEYRNLLLLPHSDFVCRRSTEINWVRKREVLIRVENTFKRESKTRISTSSILLLLLLLWKICFYVQKYLLNRTRRPVCEKYEKKSSLLLLLLLLLLYLRLSTPSVPRPGTLFCNPYVPYSWSSR